MPRSYAILIPVVEGESVYKSAYIIDEDVREGDFVDLSKAKNLQPIGSEPELPADAVLRITAFKGGISSDGAFWEAELLNSKNEGE